ncbi:DUF7504 family protein [Halorientalis salina]|uniref:DUF7504 family protein n=1 Tax=Halorientalis salina TaxID=2932266 RepID=UPI0010AC83AB|nr:hypothetical protein [Halorientalis salina]
MSPDVEPANVLVLASAMSDGKTESCYHLLTDSPPAEMDLLRIVYHRSPDHLIEEWTDLVGDLPANTAIVNVNDRASADVSDYDTGNENVEVFTANPNDLTGLGMEINNALTALSETDNDIFVCFDSVTALLQFVDVESAYKFLHMFTGQLHTTGAVGHFHIDPNAHDDQVLSRLKTTFDDMVQADE